MAAVPLERIALERFYFFANFLIVSRTARAISPLQSILSVKHKGIAGRMR
jgi:hypothetical protein